MWVESMTMAPPRQLEKVYVSPPLQAAHKAGTGSRCNGIFSMVVRKRRKTCNQHMFEDESDFEQEVLQPGNGMPERSGSRL